MAIVAWRCGFYTGGFEAPARPRSEAIGSPSLDKLVLESHFRCVMLTLLIFHPLIMSCGPLIGRLPTRGR